MGLHIELNDVSKRYNQNWILKHLEYQFEANHVYSIKGANGSGKSTLLRMLSGYLSPSQGQITFTLKGKTLEVGQVYKYLAFAAPYISVPINLSIREVLSFITQFKKFRGELSIEQVFELMKLPVPIHTFLKELSSGQAQRVNLVASIMTESDLLLLDEPSSFLDQNSKSWLMDLIQSQMSDRTVVIASNDDEDFIDNANLLDITSYR